MICDKLFSCFHTLWTLKPLLATALAFIIPLCLVVDYDADFEKQTKCAYVIIVMAILWLTEAVPIPVTALLPVFMFPMFGVVKASEISSVYFKDTTMLFLGGLIIAGALEESGLHIRISLIVMKVVGARPVFIMAGLMATTWFLSMWISNTAATSMMIPIIDAVMSNIEEAEEEYEESTLQGGESECAEEFQEKTEPDNLENNINKIHTSVSRASILKRQNSEYSKGSNVHYALDVDDESKSGKEYTRQCSESESQTDVDDIPNINRSYRKLLSQMSKEERQSVRTTSTIQEKIMMTPELHRMAKAFTLSVAYGANVGGIATLTGSPPNLVFKQQADKLYELHTGSESDVSFAKWMGFAFPLSVITGVLAWIWLIILFLRCGCCKKMDPDHEKAINSSIRHHIKKLGRITFCEVEVLVVFLLLVVLWLFRAPPNVPGWGTAGMFKKGYVSDSTPCILLSVLLFILPAEIPKVFGREGEDKPSYRPILDWKSVTDKLPWGVIVLLGGGFAIAQASEESGLSSWVGNELKVFANLDKWVMNMLICLIVAGATNVTSNTASATLLMPILSELALQTHIHPIYLMMSVGIACSFAFMLPVATPPNAIVFSTGFLTIPDMALAGLPINILAVFVLTLAINTWGTSMFNLEVFPSLFATNSTNS